MLRCANIYMLFYFEVYSEHVLGELKKTPVLKIKLRYELSVRCP